MKAISTKFIAAAGLALGLFAAASAAHAGSSEWQISIGVQPESRYYVQPAPVHVQPRPVYVQPAPYGYSRRDREWGHSRGDDRRDGRRWQRRGPYGDRDGDGIANIHDPDSPRNRRHARMYGPWGDRDRDGVPNRYDRAPQNPYRY